MKSKKNSHIFRNILSEFISSISVVLTIIGVIIALGFGLEDWRILIAIPFGCILVAVVTAWICTLIQGKDE